MAMNVCSAIDSNCEYTIQSNQGKSIFQHPVQITLWCTFMLSGFGLPLFYEKPFFCCLVTLWHLNYRGIFNFSVPQSLQIHKTQSTLGKIIGTMYCNSLFSNNQFAIVFLGLLLKILWAAQVRSVHDHCYEMKD